MGNEVNDRTVRIPIENVLGPVSERYFAAGYQRVSHHITAVHAGASDHLHLTGKATYPGDWLDGAHADRRPHLSTIDAIIFAVLAYEQLPAHLACDIRHLRVTGVELRSGTAPWTDVINVPITLRFTEGHASAAIDGEVGNIRVRLSLEGHDRAEAGQRNHEAAPREEDTVYGALFRSSRSTCTLTGFDSDRSVLKAKHLLSVPDSAPTRPSGVESVDWPSPSAIDYIVAMGQLTQALIYKSRGKDRASIGNLWMRSMSVRFNLDSEPLPCNYYSSTALVRDTVATRIGPNIHDVEVVSSTSTGAHAKAKLAYVDR